MKLFIRTDRKFGKRLRQERKRAGVTQVTAAKALRISQGTLSKAETGGCMFLPVEPLRKLLPALEIKISA